MNRILIAILVTGVGALAIQYGWFDEVDGPVDIGSFLFALGLAISAGFLVFQFRVWDGNRRALFQPRRPSLNEGPSAWHLFCEATTAMLGMIVLVIWLMFVLLEYFGQHELVVQFLEFLVTKTEKLIHALQ